MNVLLLAAFLGAVRAQVLTPTVPGTVCRGIDPWHRQVVRTLRESPDQRAIAAMTVVIDAQSHRDMHNAEHRALTAIAGVAVQGNEAAK